MEAIHVEQHGDVYSCDIGISKEEWLEILKDDKTPQTYKETVLQFYYYPAHRGSCTAVSNTMGRNTQKINANIRELGKYVQRRLGRFQVVRPDGTPCFWIIPMCEGKDLPKGSEGTFEWELRPELVEAVKDYLYWYLNGKQPVLPRYNRRTSTAYQRIVEYKHRYSYGIKISEVHRPVRD